MTQAEQPDTPVGPTPEEEPKPEEHQDDAASEAGSASRNIQGTSGVKTQEEGGSIYICTIRKPTL